MKLLSRLIVLLLLLGLLAACGGADTPEDPTAPEQTTEETTATETESTEATGDKPVIGLIMKSLGNDFFKNMEEGAIAHAAERGDVELVPLGIQNETDVEAQIALVENLIAQGADAIVVAPADSRALIPVLGQAAEAGIKIVNIDVVMDPEAMASAGFDAPFVGPDNQAGAKMVGDVLAAELGEGAQVIILEGNPGAENAAQRAAGFMEAAEAGGLEVVASQTAHWETDEAFDLVSNLLTANPDVTGIMASNDSMALGAVQAVESMGLTDSVTIVGFDNIEPIQPLVLDGTVLATLDQFGAEMAANGMDVAMEMLAGEARTGWIKTPIKLIQAADLQSGSAGTGNGEMATIGLIMKSLGNDFFKNMEEGAIAHAAERGDIDLIPLGIQNETDVEAQIALVENLITQGVDAIVVAPADSRALIPVLGQAAEAGIKIVNIDVVMDPDGMASAGFDAPFVGPDNQAGAKMVGDVLAAELGEGAKVIILEGNPGAENAAQRAAGFMEAAEAGGLEVVASQTAHWETDEAFELVSNLMTANPDVTGIMASNDSMALGAVQAIESMGLTDSVTIVGFDNIEPIQPLVLDGTVLATLDQFGAEMAANGMDVAMEMLAGEARTGWVKTPIKLIQAADLNGESSMEPTGETATIGLIMKSLGNDFFKNMEEGAIAHAAERGDIELIPLGIQNETDVEAQIALVENLITQGVDAIVVAPADSRALIPVLGQAAEAGIVIVNIDVVMDPDGMASAGFDAPFVGPDNQAGAKMVGDVLAAELGEGAKVIILEGNPGAENAAQRAAGFMEAAEAGGLEVVASQTAHWETDEAFELVSNLMTANPDVTGIMASNDSMALGAVQAIESMGLTDSVTIVGFDNIEPIQPLVLDGTVLATLDQFGALMAANGMDVAMEMLAGESYTGWVKTPIQLIQAADLQ